MKFPSTCYLCVNCCSFYASFPTTTKCVGMPIGWVQWITYYRSESMKRNCGMLYCVWTFYGVISYFNSNLYKKLSLHGLLWIFNAFKCKHQLFTEEAYTNSRTFILKLLISIFVFWSWHIFVEIEIIPSVVFGTPAQKWEKNGQM